MASAMQLTRQSPLSRFRHGADLARLTGASVSVSECAFTDKLLVQRVDGDRSLFCARAAEVFGTELSCEPNRVVDREKNGRASVWLAPDRWLVLVPGDAWQAAATFEQAIPPGSGIATVVTDQYARLQVSGATARALLAKGCPVDLDRGVFMPGQSAGTLLGGQHVTLWLEPDDSFKILIDVSLADYFWAWFKRAIREFSHAA